jgi:phosphoribosylformimino-5-aminoimidazole carboxamide ribotide isomerase
LVAAARRACLRFAVIVFPAIDLRQGRCVRLRQGDPTAETVFGADPVAMARHWVAQGAEWLHVVNLDGALGEVRAAAATVDGEPDLGGLPRNWQCLYAIRQAVEVPIQFGGGLRSLDDIALALRLGATRVILGTVAVQQPELVAAAVERFGPERIVVGIDAREGRVAIHGWRELSSLTAIDLARRLATMGVRRVVFTDIARDGMLTGVNVAATAALARLSGLRVIASGGVAGPEDILALRAEEAVGIEGVILGQALYTGALPLPTALALAKG